MTAEPAPSHGTLILAWIAVLVLIGLSCAQVVFALAVVWGATSW
ncbi:hypothetical protein [Bosea sp. MMO-172]